MASSVLQTTQSRALLLAGDDHGRITSAQRGVAAFLEAQLLDETTRQKELRSILSENIDGKNKTLSRLKEMQRQSFAAAQRLSAVTYDRIRDLHASGFMLSDIAKDLDVNYNDLLAFMRQYPNSERHAVEDAESCADAQTAELLHHIEDQKKPTTAEVDLLKIRANVQIEMNKRLSGKWAQRKEDDRATHVTNQSQFNVYLNSGGKQTKYNPQDDRIIDGDTPGIRRKVAYHGAETLVPEEIANAVDTSQMPVPMDSHQQVQTAFSELGVSLSFGTRSQHQTAPRAGSRLAKAQDYPEELLDQYHSKVSPPTTHKVGG